MTRDEEIAVAVAMLDSIDGDDPESDHQEADQILLDMVPLDVREAYIRLVARSSNWWYA